MDKIYIVMDYVEHDLKSLMETMKQPFLVGKLDVIISILLCKVFADEVLVVTSLSQYRTVKVELVVG